MLSSLKLGNRTFPNNIIQGPLAGVSCAPFRRLTWQYSQPAFSFTEMISCKTLLYQTKNNERFISKYPDEGPVCYQLSGQNPEELYDATKMVTAAGADLINLNCGCPVQKIRAKGAGSSLLKTQNLLYQLIRAMKRATEIPVSIKIRVDGLSSDKYNQEVLKAVMDAGTDFLIVHGRHWTEGYQTPCHYEQIAYFVENLHIPVIGNGDIQCISSLQKMFASGCQGAMIARAGVGQPWLIGKLMADMKNEPFKIPEVKTIGSLFFTHINDLAVLLGSEKFAVIQARKFAKYYARHIQNPQDFKHAVNQCENLQDLQTNIEYFFRP